MSGSVKRSTMALALAAGLGLAGCNRNEATAPARAHAGDQGGGAASSSAPYPSGGGYAGGGDSYARNDRGYARRGGGYNDRGGSSGDRGGYNAAPRAPVPMFHGEPMWSDNRQHTSKENAQYHFEHDGPDFGAKSLDEYLGKVHGFVDHPPSGVQTVTRRNGDRLMYDPKGNVFAVVRRDGAPRTFFKPRDGASYWTQQQAKAADDARGGGYGSGGYGRRYGSDGGQSGGAGGGQVGGADRGGGSERSSDAG